MWRKITKWLLYIISSDNIFLELRLQKFVRGTMMGWIYVFFAAFVEIFWVLGLKYSSNAFMWIGTIIIIIFSFYFIIKACALLPSGTVYAVFTGSGAAAIAIIDFTLLGAEFTVAKAAFIGLIIIGVVGIQLTTESDNVAAKSNNKTDATSKVLRKDGN